MNDEKKHLIIFTSADGKISVNAHFYAETAWLSLDQMANCFLSAGDGYFVKITQLI